MSPSRPDVHRDPLAEFPPLMSSAFQIVVPFHPEEVLYSSADLFLEVC